MEKINKSENFPEEISSRYEIIQEIGRGAFSVVYKVKSKEDNNIYCLKKINMKKTKDKENEINILSNLDHPNLIKFFYSFSNEEGIYIIMEFCEFGDLFSLLQSVKKKKVYVNEDIIWNVAIQTLLGIEYLHSKQIIHRDIKLLNLFMTKDKKIKIGDMGMSKHVEEGEMIMSRVGTPLYIAPELVKKEKYDYKIDIWSFGCSLYHLAKTSPPFNDENLVKLGNSIINEQPANLPSCYSSKLYEFILLLMTKNKEKRPSAKEALELVPEKIRNKLNNKSKEKNDKKNKIDKKDKIDNNINDKTKNSFYDNKKLKEKESFSNKNINESKTDINNDVKMYSPLTNKVKELYDMKNNDNLNININKGIVSGQTFYHFFKNNPDKKKNNKYFGVNNSELYNNKSKNMFIETKNNNNNINSQNLILSKTMLQIKEHFNRIKTPGSINIQQDNNNHNSLINNNMKNISQSYGKLVKKVEMTNIEEEKKEENLLYNNDEEKTIIEEEKEKEKSIKKLNNDLLSKDNKEYGILSNKSENIRYNLKTFNKNNLENNSYSVNKTKNDISTSFNRKEIMNKYLNNQQKKIKEKGGGGFYQFSKNINNAIKTFLIKENKNKNNKEGILYSMQLNNNKKNINNNNIDRVNYHKDNNKEEIVFPLIYQPDYRIQNRFKNKNNSTTNKNRKYPELYNNFRKTVNSNNFRNKLTIHDLK